MTDLLNQLGGEGPVWALLALSLLANGFQYLQMQAMHRENREYDRSMLQQFYDAIALIKTAVDVMKDRERR